MDVHHRYEAYRSFLSIVAGMLVADAITKFGDLRQAMASLYDFNKTQAETSAPTWLAMLVILYIWKNAHGILVTMFDEPHYQEIAKSGRRAFFACLLLTLVAASLAVVVRVGEFVPGGVDVFERGWRLLLVALVPSAMWLLFDAFNLALYGYPGGRTVRSMFGEVCVELLRNPRQRITAQEFRRVWIAQDLGTLVVAVAWFIGMCFIDFPGNEIRWTVGMLIVLLVINSVADYALNFNFFFLFNPKTSAAEGGGK
ncbi:hypothetical protein FBQ96_03775 [Nitrospirales bacterium NOB]|nr:hypothetical protein [Nitrospirales bacterium NOB]